MTEPQSDRAEPAGSADRRVFGNCPTDVVTEKWPCAYAVVFNEYNRVAVIKTPKGNILPGGGCDLGESPDAAVIRETLHGAGLTIEATGQLGSADQYVCISEEAGWVLQECTFFLAHRNGADSHPIEAGRTLLWLDPAPAMARLDHESHRWAVERALALRTERRS